VSRLARKLAWVVAFFKETTDGKPHGVRMFEGTRIRSIAAKLKYAARRAHGRAAMRVGQIASSRPLSRVWGLDRGLPVDRYYIEQFLAAHAADVRGRVLEVGDAQYSRKFGAAKVTKQDILHLDSSNPAATIAGDLSRPGLLPRKAFDCIIMTQTLQYVRDVPTALKQVREALRPGGVALLTLPGLAPLCADDWKGSFYWRFTEASLREMLAESFEPGKIEVSAFGNLYAATLFLHGAASEEAIREKLHPLVSEYAIVLTARAVA
jgi:SAM-dependent methyltransferase